MTLDLSPLGSAAPIVLAALVILGVLGVVSERLEKLGGPLGRAAKWWTQRQVRKVKASDVYTDALLEKIAHLEEQVSDLFVRQAGADRTLTRHRMWDLDVVWRLQQAGITDIPDPPALYEPIHPGEPERFTYREEPRPT